MVEQIARSCMDLFHDQSNGLLELSFASLCPAVSAGTPPLRNAFRHGTFTFR